jgi:hypothetical protein
MTLPTTATVPRPQAQGFHAALDDLLLRLFVSRDRRIDVQTEPAQAERVDTRTDRQEFAADFGDVFGRSDFTGGEGLDWAHRPGLTEDDARRYWDSKGVYVHPPAPGQTRQITLLRRTDSVLALAGSPRLVSLAGVLYATDGTSVRRTNNPTDAVPLWTTSDPNAGEAAQPVAMLASYGDEVYAALGANGVHKRSSAGVWSHFSNLAAVGVWHAKGRILVSTGQSLYEVTAADPNPAVPLRTLPPGQTWTDVVDAGVVLAGASNGYVFAFTTAVTESGTGELILVAESQFEQEAVTCLGAAQGKVFVGTSQGTTGRLWVGEVGDDGQFDGGVAREWVNGVPRSIVADCENAYTAVANPDTGETFAWRYDVTTDGVFRHHAYPASGDTWLAIVNGTLFAGVTGSGVHRASSTQYVADGYLITPLADFHSTDVKAWIGALLDVGPLPDGSKVELWYTTTPEAITDPAHPSWVRARTATASTTNVEEVLLPNVRARAIAGKFVLVAPAGAASTPAAYSCGFHMLPSESDVAVTLPVNVSDQIEMPGRAPIRVPGRGAETLAALQAREGATTLLEVYRPHELIRGVIENVSTPVEILTNRGSPATVTFVRVRGRRATSTGGAVEGGFGIDMFGVPMFGGSS